MPNLFGKLKQIKDLRAQAKKYQGAIGGELATAEHDGVSVTVNGSFELTNVVKNTWQLRCKHFAFLGRQRQFC